MSYKFKTEILFIALLMFLSGCSKDEPANQDEYPTAGLVSYYNFDNNLDDVMGNSPSGISFGGVAYFEGHDSLGLFFNGINGLVTFNRSTFHADSKISISFWFRTNISEPNFTMMSCNDFEVFTKYSTARLLISAPSTDNAYGYFSYNTWTHFVGTYDGVYQRVYINGILRGLRYNPGYLSGNSGLLKIGYDTYNDAYWAGSLDDFFIYNRALTQDGVTALYER
ncbi:MAG: LamG domain-containing protein [Bacteroidetes bacterium]|nr:LamG domain-containing protein [Bacteroidota bacterium]